jgi:dihydrofolate reductase
MRKVIYAMLVSVDGFIETTSGDLGWTTPDAELHQHFNDEDRAVDVFLYGRKLYEIMAGFWPTADEDPSAPPYITEYAQIWKPKEKVVFSNTLIHAGWNARVFSGDIATEVNRLKALPGEIMSVGGPGLAATFIQLGLIDEYRLYMHPILLGGGKPMFPQLTHAIDLNPLETRKFGSGVVLLRYAKKGAA